MFKIKTEVYLSSKESKIEDRLLSTQEIEEIIKEKIHSLNYSSYAEMEKYAKDFSENKKRISNSEQFKFLDAFNFIFEYKRNFINSFEKLLMDNDIKAYKKKLQDIFNKLYLESEEYLLEENIKNLDDFIEKKDIYQNIDTIHHEGVYLPLLDNSIMPSHLTIDSLYSLKEDLYIYNLMANGLKEWFKYESDKKYPFKIYYLLESIWSGNDDRSVYSETYDNYLTKHILMRNILFLNQKIVIKNSESHNLIIKKQRILDISEKELEELLFYYNMAHELEDKDFKYSPTSIVKHNMSNQIKQIYKDWK